MSKITSIVAGAAVLPILAFAAPATAAELPTGQFEGGNIYRVANVTRGGDFTDPTSATCGDTVQFRVRIHNVGANAAENVKVQATLPTAVATSHSSRVTLSSTNSNTVNDTAGVNLDKAGKLAYVAGSTELLDANQAKVGNLADGIVGAGVTLQNPVGVSTQQKVSVQFQAKVTCEETPVTPGEIRVCVIDTKKIVTIKENEFDSAKHTRDLSKCDVTPATPTTLVKTGPAQVVAIFAAAAAFGALAYNVVLRRQNAR